MKNTSIVTSSNKLTLQTMILQKVYLWMAVGLGITAIASFYTMQSEEMMDVAQKGFLGFVIVELALVFVISWFIKRISPSVAGALFLVYAALNGITLSLVVSHYTSDSVAIAFTVTAGTFIATSFYGITTKRDLSSLGSILFMLLIGLILASLVNLFLHSSMMEFVLSILGVVVFVGLTAYDTQKIKNNYYASPIMGALALYLDFINLFLYMLRLFGSKK
jgi:FtsH-binding integral membrane protein